MRERVPEALARPPSDFGQRFLCHSYRVEYVAALFAQKLEALFGFFKLLKCHHIHRPDLIELATQLIHSRLSSIRVISQISGQAPGRLLIAASEFLRVLSVFHRISDL